MKKADVIKFFKTGTKVAAALGISKAAVSDWPEDIPLGRAYQLQVLTRGRLRVEPRVPATTEQ